MPMPWVPSLCAGSAIYRREQIGWWPASRGIEYVWVNGTSIRRGGVDVPGEAGRPGTVIRGAGYRPDRPTP